MFFINSKICHFKSRDILADSVNQNYIKTLFICGNYIYSFIFPHFFNFHMHSITKVIHNLLLWIYQLKEANICLVEQFRLKGSKFVTHENYR